MIGSGTCTSSGCSRCVLRERSMFSAMRATIVVSQPPDRVRVNALRQGPWRLPPTARPRRQTARLLGSWGLHCSAKKRRRPQPVSVATSLVVKPAASKDSTMSSMLANRRYRLVTITRAAKLPSRSVARRWRPHLSRSPQRSELGHLHRSSTPRRRGVRRSDTFVQVSAVVTYS
jgi:hypothetical protein